MNSCSPAFRKQILSMIVGRSQGVLKYRFKSEKAKQEGHVPNA